jgi:hypothetical protein
MNFSCAAGDWVVTGIVCEIAGCGANRARMTMAALGKVKGVARMDRLNIKGWVGSDR